LVENWSLLILALGRKLIGDEVDDIFVCSQSETATTYSISTEEVDAFGAYYVDPSTLVMPLFSAPIELRLIMQQDTPSNSMHPPMYVTSSSVPPYVRLHLLSQILQQIKLGKFFESDEGLLMAAMRILEKDWAVVEDHGPPNVSAVLKYLIPLPVPRHNESFPSASTAPPMISKMLRRRDGDRKYVKLSNNDIKKQFMAMSDNTELLNTRRMLPVFSAKEKFLNMLEKSRVVVVVGETGKSSLFLLVVKTLTWDKDVEKLHSVRRI
jgi:hypothetical protein